MKAIFFGSNGYADSPDGKINGTPLLGRHLRYAADEKHPERKMRIAHVGNAAMVLPPSKQGHLAQTIQRLTNDGFEVVDVNLDAEGAVDRILNGNFDILYLNGGYPPEARRVFEESGLIRRMNEVQEKLVIAAFSASAMALGLGNLFLARTIKEAKPLHRDYADKYWRGAGVIEAIIVPHAPIKIQRSLALIPDGEFFIQTY